MQSWAERVAEKTVKNLLISKGLVTEKEYEEEYNIVKKEAWDNRHNACQN